MPNHVTNILTTEYGDDEALKTLLDDKGEVDFNVLIPMPECLKDFNPHGGITSRAKALLGLFIEPDGDTGLRGITSQLEIQNTIRCMFEPIAKEDIPLVSRAVDAYQECGYMYWYDWTPKKWGTKWNAYDQKVEDNVIKFETAWSAPNPVMIELSKKVPDTIFILRYADEDLGRNCGVTKFKDGQIVSEKDMTGDNEFAFKTCYPDDDPADHELNENYEYVEED